MVMLDNNVIEIIEQKLKQGKRIEMEYNHQTNEIKLLEHKITRIKLENYRKKQLTTNQIWCII